MFVILWLGFASLIALTVSPERLEIGHIIIYIFIATFNIIGCISHYGEKILKLLNK